MEVEIQNISDNKICRTCLSTQEPLLDIFHCNNLFADSKITFCNMLLSVAYIQINPGEGLPEEICQSCAEKAITAYNFKLLCESSDAILRKESFSQQCVKLDGVLQQALLPTSSLVVVKSPNIHLLPIIKADPSNISDNKQIITDSFKEVVENITFKSEPKDLNQLKVSHKKPKSRNNKKKVFNDSVENESEISDNDFDFGDDILEQKQQETFTCLICSLSFKERSELLAHKKTHPLDMKHSCHLCGKSFSRFYTLRHHVITHSEHKAHLCSICGKRFHLAGGLRQHLKYHQGVKPHACKLCDKRYYSPNLLKEHIRCAHSNNRYNISCKICNKKFTAKSTLKMHMKIHTGERPHACDTCGKRFTRATYLKNHSRQHTKDPPPRVFLCTYEDCGRMYTAKASLDIHIRHTHTKEKPYACKVCEKSFSSLPGLSEHNRVHTGEKREECVVCGNRFVNKQSLKKHMRLHTGEKPYPCTHCGECFLSSSRRNEHVQTKHMERQLECPICQKRFHLRRILKGHLQIHSGEKLAQANSQPQQSNPLPINSDSKQNVPEPGFEVIV